MDYNGPRSIPPDVATERLRWLAAEGRTITRGALAAIELLGEGQDTDALLRGLLVLHRDREDERRQWSRYAAPRSRLGRWLVAVGWRVGMWVG